MVYIGKVGTLAVEIITGTRIAFIIGNVNVEVALFLNQCPQKVSTHIVAGAACRSIVAIISRMPAVGIGLFG